MPTPMPPTRPSPSPSSSPHHATLLSLLLLLPFIALLVLVAARWSPLLALDQGIATSLHRTAVTDPGLTSVSKVFSDWVWDPWTLRALLVVAAVVLLRRSRYVLGCWVVLTAAVGTALQQALKALVGRQRPEWPDPVDSAHYAAFPSGHAMTAAVAGGLALWLLRLSGARRRWLWAAAVLVGVSVAGVGLTRVYLGVHWATDVLGGWLLGGALVAAAAAGYAHRYGPRR
ncbi:phosphatase PAP2 family protein [Streptomyces chrestomyceticus JCM 4735]|uniref:Phosphatase PAP2 family protein n=1 Tax=Streptomyces chrestomyceticus JCM 4735 TaxID=1306181 RepID=A0A7U9L2T6_9ACTN|nr:phosphatase PAP2 family protein [Streptomyces chrestomyceticus]GCD39183.1 phosphatase PAP2 family protein [Streptomyces chrestomyceticus JCM 4735]